MTRRVVVDGHTVEVVRVRKRRGFLHRVVTMVDGKAVTFRSNERRWRCFACGIEEQANCLHVTYAARAVRHHPRELTEFR